MKGRVAIADHNTYVIIIKRVYFPTQFVSIFFVYFLLIIPVNSCMSEFIARHCDQVATEEATVVRLSTYIPALSAPNAWSYRPSDRRFVRVNTVGFDSRRPKQPFKIPG
jgi:hypothetical protein